MDGDANLLDKTLILYGSPMANGNTHNHRNCPLILLGHGGGALEGGLHVKAANDTPMANVMLTLLHKLGLDDIETFGDSTGEFSFAATRDHRRLIALSEERDASRDHAHRIVLIASCLACARRGACVRSRSAAVHRAPTRRSPTPRCAATPTACATLLRDGADVNAAQGDGMTALHWTALNGDLKTIERAARRRRDDRSR